MTLLHYVDIGRPPSWMEWEAIFAKIHDFVKTDALPYLFFVERLICVGTIYVQERVGLAPYSMGGYEEKDG